MSLTVGELNAVLGLDQGPFDRGLRQSERKFGGLGGALAGMAKKAAVGMAAGLAGGAVAGVRTFADLERGMNEVFTLLPGISEDAMGQMTGQVKDFSKEFGTLPNEVVPALYQSLSAGVPPDNVFEFMETAQQAAIGGVTDLSTAVDGITSVVNAYGDQIGGAAEASDLMFTAVRLGKTDFGQLSSSLFNVIPTASALGVQFSDVTAAMAAMTAQGTPTSVATTQMRQLLVELSKEGTGTAKTFEKIAGESFRDFIAGGGDVQGALTMMADEASKSGGSISDMFGSVEAGSAALSLTSSKGAELFGDALDEMANSAGATEQAYDQMDQGISRSWDKIKASGSVALANLGESLAPLVASVAAFAEDTLPRLAEQIGPMVTGAIATTTQAIQTAITFWQQFKVPILVVVGVLAASYIPTLVRSTIATVTAHAKQMASWVATRAKALWSIATMIGGMVKLVAKYAWMGVKALLHAGKVAASWVVAMGPVGWVIAGVVALVALIIANWDKVVRFTKRMAQNVANWFRNARDWVVDAARTMRDWVVDRVRSLRDRVVGAVTNLRDRVVGFFRGLKDRALGIVEAMVVGYLRFVFNLRDRVVGAITGLRDRVVSMFRNLKDRALEQIRALMDRIRGIKDSILGFFSGAGTWLLDAGKKLIGGLVDGIKNMAMAPVEAAKGIVGRVRNLLPFSPAKDGPLSGSGSPEIAGRKIATMMASGILSQTSTVAAAADRMAAAAMPNLGAPLATVGTGTAGITAGSTNGQAGGPLRLIASGSGDSLLERTLLKAIQQGLITLEAETA